MGVSNFLLGACDVALEDFEEALLYLRGNQNMYVHPCARVWRLSMTVINRNYEQLGLNFKLYAAEVLFNKGMCLIYLDRMEEGVDALAEASTVKETENHDVIDEAIRDQGDGYTVFSVVCNLNFPFRHVLNVGIACRPFVPTV